MRWTPVTPKGIHKNVVYAPSCGRFSCSYVPYWVPQAQADTGDGCPDSIREALKDESWLRDRIESISNETVTTGVVYDEDGEPTKFVSGQEDAAKIAVEVGHEVGAFPQPGSPIVVDHVEVKVAAAMRRGDVKQAVLLINNPEGRAVGMMLAPGPTPVSRLFLSCLRPGRH